MGLPLGFTVVTDRNQYLGLKDSDGDGRPNIVDDFPDDDNNPVLVMPSIKISNGGKLF